MVQLWMKDLDKVVEQPIGTERCLLIERTQFHITAIDVMLAESLKLVVTMVFSTKFIVSNIMVTAITEKPDVCITSLLQNTLKG